MRNFLLSLTAFFFFHFLQAQPTADSLDPCNLRISLLTCTPGAELYSTFGHSALRVVDNNAGTEVIYNYGTFDFEDPDFYSKFIRGKLLYFVSEETIDEFLGQYKYEQRGVTEQVLDLSCGRKQQLLAFLQENAKEENKYYKYDFVYDNCTTRLRDIVFSKAGGPVITKDIRPQPGVSFRNLIHEYLDKNGQQWSKFGIDILLGSPLDKKISNSEAMFLPDYLLKAFDSTVVDDKKLVSEKTNILPATTIAKSDTFFTPFVAFGILFLVIAILSFIKKARGFFHYFDFVFFFLCGALGAFLIFMWTGTDHQTAQRNFNLVWAFPGHLIIPFFFSSKKKWVKGYWFFTVILLLLLLLAWRWLPQEMNNGLLPVVALLLLRSFMRFKSSGHGY